MSVDIFTPRQMAVALRRIQPATTFLKDTFFPTVETFLTENIDVDVYVGARRLAPFVNPKGPGKYVERIGFTTSSVTPPTIAPKMSTTAEDVQKRVVGEQIYSGISPDERARQILGADLVELDNMIARREEWMCAQALFNSAIVVSGDDVNYTITYPRDASLSIGTLSGTAAWSHASANIYKNLRDWVLLLAAYGETATDIVMSTEALDAFLTSPGIIGSATAGGVLSILRADLGGIAPTTSSGGAQYWGMLAGTGLRIWTYNGYFIDPADGVQKSFVPAKKVLVGCRGARTAMRYGGVWVTNDAGNANSFQEGARIPETWVEREPSVRWLKVTSRPLPVPINNAFLTAQVVA